ncbi:MAG: O-antigen ligase family protein [Patescibacteria group bacterium]
MNKENQAQIYLLAIFLVILAVLAVIIKPSYILFVLILVLAIGLFYRYTTLGLYLITFLYPLTYLEIIYKDLNVPYVDVLAMVVFVAWAIKALVRHFKGEQKLSWANFPGLFYFVLFIIASSLSLINAADNLLTIKYILRPLSFFYLMFVILPYNLIEDKKILKNIFKIFYFLGISVAIMGLWSLIAGVGAEGFFRRAVPLALFGIRPLGWNHNLIAEVLIAAIPFSVILIWQAREGNRKRWLFLGVLLMVLINLATFSRTGWIALIVELLILFLIQYWRQWQKIVVYTVLIAICLSPALIYMYLFSTSYIAQSSNWHRLYLTTIAIQSWHKHPLLGNGAGSFTELVASDPIFMLEFGDTQESHGVIQKLLAESGVLGLFTFTLLLVFVLWRIVWAYRFALTRQDPWSSVVLICLVVAIGAMVFQLFQTSYFVSKMWFPLGVALAATKFVKNST